MMQSLEALNKGEGEATERKKGWGGGACDNHPQLGEGRLPLMLPMEIPLEKKQSAEKAYSWNWFASLNSLQVWFEKPAGTGTTSIISGRPPRE